MCCLCVCVHCHVHLQFIFIIELPVFCVCCSCSPADVPVETEPEVNSVVITTTLSAGCSANTSYLPDAVNISLYHEVLNARMYYIRSCTVHTIVNHT